MRRLLVVAAALWVGRWAAYEVAAYVARRHLPPGPPSRTSPRRPGRIPGPFERS